MNNSLTHKERKVTAQKAKILTSKRIGRYAERANRLADGDVLTSFLNSNEGEDSGRRVAHLMLSLRELENPEIFTRLPGSGLWKFDMNRHWSTYHAVQETLERYSFRLTIAIPSRTGGKVNIAADLSPKLSSQMEEAVAVARLHRLLGAGSLANVRTCPSCRQWFMARRTDQTKCSARCTQKIYRETQEYLDGKVSEMRERRKTALQAKIERIVKVRRSLMKRTGSDQGWEAVVLRELRVFTKGPHANEEDVKQHFLTRHKAEIDRAMITK